MALLTPQPTDLFTGDVYFDVITRGEAPSRMRVNRVRFTPGAMTHLATWENDETTWGEHVTDQEHRQATAQD